MARGGSIISLGVNSNRYFTEGEKYRTHEHGEPTFHAEIKALLNLPRKITKGAIMYVARCSKDGKDAKISKPCTMCHAVMEERGIRKVYYTVNNEVIGTYKL